MSKDTHSVAAIDVTGNVVTAIYVSDVTRQHSDTSSITAWDFGRIWIQLDVIVGNGVTVCIQRKHIRLATTAKNIFNRHSCSFYLCEQTFRTGHATLVTTTIEVTDRATLQIPSRTDSHIRLVVTTKESAYLVGVTTWV